MVIKMKRFASILYIVIIIALTFCGAALTAVAEADDPDAEKSSAVALRVAPVASDAVWIDVLDLPAYEDCPHVLFLPAGIDRSRLRVSFDGPELSVNGVPLTSGAATNVFSQDGDCTVTTPQGSFPLKVVSSENLPAIYLNTESGSLSPVHADKSHKEKATLWAAENDTLTVDGAALEYLKGRGNTSWRAGEKRSYNIKFEEKTPLLGMKAAKKWALISNNLDPTLMRNAVAYTAARLTGLPYTVDFAFADLYIDGVYRGNYMVCEKIEVGKNRIDIADLDDANKKANPGLTLSDARRMESVGKKKAARAWCDLPADPKNITGGYLLEFEYPDAFAAERSAFITEYGTCLILHTPEYATKSEIDYIAELYEGFEQALLAKDGVNKEGKHFSEYIDMDSFVDGLLLYDFTADQDGGHTSWYLYLPENSDRFYMGPVWDFDMAMDDADAAPDLAAAQARAMYDRRHPFSRNPEKTMIEMLCSRREFVDLESERFRTLSAVFREELVPAAETLFQRIERSAATDALRWRYSVDQRKDVRLRSYVSERTARLEECFANLDAEIQTVYDQIKASGGDRTSSKGHAAIIYAGGGVAAAALIVTAVLVRKKRYKKKK